MHCKLCKHPVLYIPYSSAYTNGTINKHHDALLAQLGIPTLIINIKTSNIGVKVALNRMKISLQFVLLLASTSVRYFLKAGVISTLNKKSKINFLLHRVIRALLQDLRVSKLKELLCFSCASNWLRSCKMMPCCGMYFPHQCCRF